MGSALRDQPPARLGHPRPAASQRLLPRTRWAQLPRSEGAAGVQKNSSKAPRKRSKIAPFNGVVRDAPRHRLKWPIYADSGWPDYADSRHVQLATAQALEDLTGPAAEGRPFPSNVLFPRRVTEEVVGLFKEGHTLVLLEGAPLSGKSNVLRDFVFRMSEAEDLAPLYLEAGVRADP